MERGHLAILNKDSLQVKHTEFKKNTNYRILWDENGKGCIINGEWLTKQKFDANFVMYIPLLHLRLQRLGLMVDGKAIPFKDFKERGYVVGKGYINLHIYSHPKENMFSFYPVGTRTKVEGIKYCYRMLVDLVEGGSDFVDGGYIRWSNCGLPLGGGYPRREELQDEFFKKKEISLDILK
jgi:hypothetical protein